MRNINTIAVLAAIVIPLVCGFVVSFLITNISLFSTKNRNAADSEPDDDYDL